MSRPAWPAGDLTRREALGRGGRLLIAAAGGSAAASLAGSGSSQARGSARANWGALGRSLRGPLLRPGDAGFRAASAAENYLYASVVPAGIALCTEAKDVETCVRWARDNDVPLVAGPALARPMSESGVATVLEWTKRCPGAGPTEGRLDYWLWGGAMNTPSPSSTAFVHRNDTSLFAVSGSWPAATPRRHAQPIINWVNHTWAAVGPHATDYAYQNFIDPALKNSQHAYYGANLPRLIEAKHTYDPDNLFNFPQSIPTSHQR